MTTMSTILRERDSAEANTLKSSFGSHSTFNPRLVIEKRREAINGRPFAEYGFQVVVGTSDAEGNPLPQPCVFFGGLRYPVKGENAQVVIARDIGRDIIASDNFANSVLTLDWLSAHVAS